MAQKKNLEMNRPNMNTLLNLLDVLENIALKVNIATTGLFNNRLRFHSAIICDLLRQMKLSTQF